MEELNLENSLQKSFAHSIKMQLDPVWNQLVCMCCRNPFVLFLVISHEKIHGYSKKPGSKLFPSITRLFY